MVQLLIVNGADIKAKNKSGQTPFVLATDMGYTEIAELLKESETMPPVLWAAVGLGFVGIASAIFFKKRKTKLEPDSNS